MPSPDDHWLDEEAGPVVRPYALIRGRTRPTGETLDLIAIITAVRGAQLDVSSLDPEHLAVLRICRLPTSVAEIASDLDLPWAWSGSCWVTCRTVLSSRSTTRFRRPGCQTCRS